MRCAFRYHGRHRQVMLRARYSQKVANRVVLNPCRREKVDNGAAIPWFGPIAASVLARLTSTSESGSASRVKIRPRSALCHTMHISGHLAEQKGTYRLNGKIKERTDADAIIRLVDVWAPEVNGSAIPRAYYTTPGIIASIGDDRAISLPTGAS